jgi:hypothetical protein
MSMNRIIVALIGFAATVLAAYIMVSRGQLFANHRTFTGRVLNASTFARVANAKVSLDGEGVPPILYTDSEGMFSFRWPTAATTVRLTIEAPGFPLYERRVSLESISENEDIRLDPVSSPPVPPSNRTVKPVVEGDTPAPRLHASIVNPLPTISGENGPWAVILIGDHPERRDDVASWVRSALGGGGHDGVSLFRKVSDEQRVGVSLFRGGVGVLSGLDAGRYCSRILVGKLSVASLGSTEGLTIARATLAVHLLSPAGEMQKAFELTEKGGGVNDETAQVNAINELQTVIQRDLAAKTQ